MADESSLNIFNEFEKDTAFIKGLIEDLFSINLENNSNLRRAIDECLEKNSWVRFKEDNKSSTKMMEIQFESKTLDFIMESKNEISEIDKIMDISIELSCQGIIDSIFPCALLETLCDTISLRQIKQIFDKIMTKEYFKIKDLVTNQGKGQILLRTYNNLLKKIPRISESSFRGSVMMFFSSIFKQDDRSGVNLKGEFDSSELPAYQNFEEECESDLPASQIPKFENSVCSNNDETVIPKISVINDTGNLEKDVEMSRNNNNEDVTIDDISSKDNIDSAELNKYATLALDEEPVVVVKDEDFGALKKRKRYDAFSGDFKSFYCDFWKLQIYFQNPSKTFEGENFGLVKDILLKTLEKINQKSSLKTQKKLHSKSETNGLEFDFQNVESVVNYRTTPELFERQFYEPKFRLQILLQILIFCKYCLIATEESVKSLMAIPNLNKSVLPNFKISPNEALLIGEIRQKALVMLSSKNFNMRNLDTSIINALKSDNLWVVWKNKMCKSEGKPPAKEFIAKSKEVMAKIYNPKPLSDSTDVSFVLEEPEFMKRLGKLSEVPNCDGLKKKIIPRTQVYFNRLDELISDPELPIARNKQKEDIASRMGNTQAYFKSSKGGGSQRDHQSQK
ncbi:hypothetical protein BB560_004258 [Smittium megazygosporum]|uniref:THO complex subunit 1 n=1 Tax=Smittium megazygosporum TaxID=133381 RepID=A0A2T9Z9T6_9FUNG|nr:hypothetical protein BB560_004258 [Smittium megazygosporum]